MTELSVHEAHEYQLVERGRELTDAEIACYLADHQTALRHGTAMVGDEIAEQLRDRLIGDPWRRQFGGVVAEPTNTPDEQAAIDRRLRTYGAP